MYPLNGPCWSLFFEYIGNLLYALILRRLRTAYLAFVVLMGGFALLWFTVSDASGYGSLGVGWTLDGMNFVGGFLRMFVPFGMGLLLSRVFRPIRIKGSFWWCTAVLLVLFHVPYIAGLSKSFCLNGIFESVCILLVFPLLVWMGASGVTTDRKSTAICRFLGDISFPLYIVHYPLMYLFYSWLIKTSKFTFAETWPVAIVVYVGSVVLAWLCLKFYDIPVRRKLVSRFLRKSENKN